MRMIGTCYQAKSGASQVENVSVRFYGWVPPTSADITGSPSITRSRQQCQTFAANLHTVDRFCLVPGLKFDTQNKTSLCMMYTALWFKKELFLLVES